MAAATGARERTVTASVEMSSGKTAADENFPVGSWLLPPALRPHVAIFYAFARAIDDIADNSVLPPTEKLARLDGFAAALSGASPAAPGYDKAHRMRSSLAETGITDRHCLDLVAAFKQDSVKGRYADWGELIGYCLLSASPVGRYLLDLHGESRHAYPIADALCNALQILNHLQDCQDDYRQLDRVYLPLDWLAAAGGTVEALDQPQSLPAVRQVIDRCLDGVDRLLDSAAALPGSLRSRRLAMESAVTWRLARRLAARLRRGDPLAERVALSRTDFLGCGLAGIGQGLLGRRPPAASAATADRSA